MTYPWVQLRYVAKTGTGHTPSRTRPELWIDSERTIPWVTLADVGRLRDHGVDVLYETVEQITPAGVANSAAVVHPSGTVLLSRTASVGFSALTGRSMAVSQDFMTWTPGPRLHGRFLLHAIRAIRPRLLGLMYGSTHKTIYMPDLMAIKLPLPPLNTQRAIAQFLDRECMRIRELSVHLREMVNAVDEGCRALIGERLDEAAAPVRPLTWAVDPARPVVYGIVLPGDPVDDGVLLVKGRNVERDELLPDDLVRVAADIERPFARARLRTGDLLITIRGSFGAIAQVPPESDGANITQDTARIAPATHVDRRYLLHALRGWRAQRELRALARGTGVRGLNIYDLRRLQLPFPSLSDQRAIARDLDRISSSRVGARNRLANLRHSLNEYRDAIVTEAVTGQLDVTAVSEQQMDERMHEAIEAPR